MKTAFLSFLSAITLMVGLVFVQSAEAQSFLQAAACYLSGSNTVCLKTINVASGGTGAATFTAHGVMLGEGTGALVPTAVGTSSQVLVGSTGADPGWGNVPAAALPAISQSTAGVDASSGQRLGTNTNDTANAGNIGEQLTQSRVRSAATSLTSTTNTNITATSLSLTAGNWLLMGQLCYIPAGTTTTTLLQSGLSATSATLSGSDTRGVCDATGQVYTNWALPSGTVVGNDLCFIVGPCRVSLSGTTPYYLIAVATFGTSTMTAYGSITGTRVR